MATEDKWIRNVPEDRRPSYYESPYFKMSFGFDQNVLINSLTYQAKPGDLFISTYPKSGTTWTQFIVYLLQHDAIVPNYEEFRASSVFLELQGKEAAEALVAPGAIKVHLPFQLTPYNERAKYIVVVRNPKDVVVSYFHHTHGMDKFYNWSHGTFDDFFDLFIGGQVEYGDYYDHLHSWLGQKDAQNVLILTYEYMKAFTKDAVKKIAHFMDAEIYGKRVDEDEDFVNRVIENSSVKLMKKKFQSMAGLVSTDKDFQFVRKGIVNDWKNVLSEEQNKLISDRFREEAGKNTALMQLWHDYSWLNQPVSSGDN